MKKKKFKSLQTKIVSLTLSVGILSILIAMAFVYLIGNRAIEKIIGANFKELAFETSERADSYIEHHLEESRFLAMGSEILSILREREKLYSKKYPLEVQQEIDKIDKSWENIQLSEPVLTNILNNKASDFLRKFNVEDLEEEPIHYRLLITDSKGVVVASINKPDKYLYSKEDGWKKTYNNDGRKYIPDLTFNKSINGFSFDIITPIQDNGITIGIILMSHEVERFFKTVTSVKVGETDHTMLVSSDGIVQFCPILPVKSHSLTEELIKIILKDKAGWAATDADVHHFGKRSIVGYSPVSLSLSLGKPNFGGNKWYIITSQDPKETYAPIHTLLNWVAVLGVLAVGLLCFLEISALKKIVRPIKMLKEGARLIGEGNLTHRLEIDSKDEVEEVAVQFNEMAAKLK
jgi:methyl-accepting chemotaxis protein